VLLSLLGDLPHDLEELPLVDTANPSALEQVFQEGICAVSLTAPLQQDADHGLQTLTHLLGRRDPIGGPDNACTRKKPRNGRCPVRLCRRGLQKNAQKLDKYALICIGGEPVQVGKDLLVQTLR